MDGKDIGTSPAVDIRVLPGDHYVEIADDRYRLAGVKFSTIEGGDLVIDVNDTPKLAAIQFLARDSAGGPVEAEITIDGRKVGRTPSNQELMIGRHEVTIGTEGEVWSGSVDVKEGDQRKEIVQLMVREGGANPPSYPLPDVDTAPLRALQWTVSLAGTKDQSWIVAAPMPSKSPWGLVVGGHVKLGMLSVGAEVGGIRSGSGHPDIYGTSARSDWIITTGITTRIQLIDPSWELYGLGGARGAWGGADFGSGDSATHYALSGTGLFVEYGGGIAVPVRKSAGGRSGGTSLYFEWVVVRPDLEFVAVDIGVSTGGIVRVSEPFDQYRLGVRGAL